MTAPASPDSDQPHLDDRDKPIPVSERYRKSFIATLTWSSLAILIAVGSLGRENVILPLTQMTYSTSLAVIVSFFFAVYWFLHFHRSEKLLEIASSEFSVGLSASSLPQALEAFRQQVLAKTYEIGVMEGVKEPYFTDGRMALLESEALLNELINRLGGHSINEYGGNVKHFIEKNKKDLQIENQKQLSTAIDLLIKDISNKIENVSDISRRQREIVKIWDDTVDAIESSGRSAFQQMEAKLKDVTEVAKKLNETSSQISNREKKYMFYLEYLTSRIWLGAAAIAGLYNITSNHPSAQASMCGSGQAVTLCVPKDQIYPFSLPTPNPSNHADVQLNAQDQSDSTIAPSEGVVQ